MTIARATRAASRRQIIAHEGDGSEKDDPKHTVPRHGMVTGASRSSPTTSLDGDQSDQELTPKDSKRRSAISRASSPESSHHGDVSEQDIAPPAKSPKKKATRSHTPVSQRDDDTSQHELADEKDTLRRSKRARKSPGPRQHPTFSQSLRRTKISSFDNFEKSDTTKNEEHEGGNHQEKIIKIGDLDSSQDKDSAGKRRSECANIENGEIGAKSVNSMYININCDITTDSPRDGFQIEANEDTSGNQVNGECDEDHEPEETAENDAHDNDTAPRTPQHEELETKRATAKNNSDLSGHLQECINTSEIQSFFNKHLSTDSHVPLNQTSSTTVDAFEKSPSSHFSDPLKHTEVKREMYTRQGLRISDLDSSIPAILENQKSRPSLLALTKRCNIGDATALHVAHDIFVTHQHDKIRSEEVETELLIERERIMTVNCALPENSVLVATVAADDSKQTLDHKESLIRNSKVERTALQESLPNCAELEVKDKMKVRITGDERCSIGSDDKPVKFSQDLFSNSHETNGDIATTLVKVDSIFSPVLAKMEPKELEALEIASCEDISCHTLGGDSKKVVVNVPSSDEEISVKCVRKEDKIVDTGMNEFETNDPAKEVGTARTLPLPIDEPFCAVDTTVEVAVTEHVKNTNQCICQEAKANDVIIPEFQRSTFPTEVINLPNFDESTADHEKTECATCVSHPALPNTGRDELVVDEPEPLGDPRQDILADVTETKMEIGEFAATVVAHNAHSVMIRVDNKTCGSNDAGVLAAIDINRSNLERTGDAINTTWTVVEKSLPVDAVYTQVSYSPKVDLLSTVPKDETIASTNYSELSKLEPIADEGVDGAPLSGKSGVSVSSLDKASAGMEDIPTFDNEDLFDDFNASTPCLVSDEDALKQSQGSHLHVVVTMNENTEGCACSSEGSILGVESAQSSIVVIEDTGEGSDVLGTSVEIGANGPMDLAMCPTKEASDTPVMNHVLSGNLEALEASIFNVSARKEHEKSVDNVRVTGVDTERFASCGISPDNVPHVHLGKLKIQMYDAAVRVHGGKAVEKLFALYWSNLCCSVSQKHTRGSRTWKETREEMNLFLATRKLRRLHNAILLGIMNLASHTITLGSAVKHVPLRWIGRVGKRQKIKGTEINEEATMGRWRTGLAYHAVDGFTKSSSDFPGILEAGVVFGLSTNGNRRFTGLSSCLPGALVVDPLIRSLVEEGGLKVSENAVWLIIVAVREYISSLLKSTILNTQAIEGEHFVLGRDSIPLFPTRESKKNKSVSVTSISQVDRNASRDECITAIHIASLLSARPSRSSIGGAESHLAYERCLQSSFDILHTSPPVEFNLVTQHICKSIEGSGRKRRRLSNVPMAGDPKEPMFSPPIADSRNSLTNDMVVPPPIVASPPPGQTHFGRSHAQRRSPGMGRGAKNLAALKARASTGSETPKETSSSEAANAGTHGPPLALELRDTGTPSCALPIESVALISPFAAPAQPFPPQPVLVPPLKASVTAPAQPLMMPMRIKPSLPDLATLAKASMTPMSPQIPATLENAESMYIQVGEHPSEDMTISEEPESANYVRHGDSTRGARGRGFGVKNLAAMRARSSTELDESSTPPLSGKDYEKADVHEELPLIRENLGQQVGKLQQMEANRMMGHVMTAPVELVAPVVKEDFSPVSEAAV